MERLCLYAGAVTSPNVERLLSNLTAVLAPEWSVDIVAADPVALGLDETDARVRSYEPPTVRDGYRTLSTHVAETEPAAVLQVTRPPTHGTVAGLAARRHEVPFVYRYSGDRFYEYRVARGRDRLPALAIGAALGRLPLRLADRHVALGPTGRRRLLARGVHSERTVVLPPAVDPDRFTGTDPATLDVPDDRHVAMFVGRLSRLKGVESLEAAIPAVVDRRPDLQFVLVGPRERRLDLPPEARDRVTYVDPVPPAEITGLLRAADVLVHPSLTEGIPRVVLEALAAETRVLARDVGDVASVTDNTFQADAELVDALTDFETLPLDDVTPFTVDALAPRYRDFFERFR